MERKILEKNILDLLAPSERPAIIILMEAVSEKENQLINWYRIKVKTGVEDLEEKKKLEDAITDLRFAIAVLKNGY